MTQLKQDFTIYQGDAGSPQFTVLDQAGVAIDISGVSDIVWAAARNSTSTPVLTKKKSADSGITFVTTGTDGKFQVNFVGADTTALSGFYVFEAQLVDSEGNQSTVAQGRFQVGRLPQWSYSGNPSISDLDAVRFLVGDTDQTDQLLQDGEVLWTFSVSGDHFGAAYLGCLAIAAKFSRKADQSSGQSRLMFSQQAKAYQQRARDFEAEMTKRGVAPYAGGVSRTDMLNIEEDTDRVEPSFNIGMDDDLIPVGRSGNEQQELNEISGPE